MSSLLSKPSTKDVEVPKTTEPMDMGDVGEALDAITIILDVEDIDKEDHNNPQLCAEYVNEIYHYMRQLEVN